MPSKKTSKALEISLGGDVISVDTVKKQYAKDATIFRLVNNTPNEEKSYLKVNGEKIDLTFGKYEVKTVVYENGSLKEIYEMII